MSIIGVDEVEASNGRLVLRRGDRLTPLARDRAHELDIDVVDETATATTSSSARPAAREAQLSNPGALPSPTLPALFRRGAPYPGLRGRTKTASASAPSSGRAQRVTIVGSGNVGTHTAMRLAETDLIDEIVLVDVVEGLAKGVALDLVHASGLLGFATSIRGVSTVEEAGPSDYTIITAGRPRTPGMSRTDLTEANAAIVGPTAEAVGRVSPQGVIIVVTNPLDEMTQLAWRRSGLDAARVVGMAGLLDSARFQALAGTAANARPDRVSAFALGAHGDEMLIPLSQARIGDIAASRVLGENTASIVDRTRSSGAEVVGLLGKGSAFITPGLAAARMVEQMIRGASSVLSATVRAQGEYGIHDTYIGLPVRLGRHGVTDIVELPLTNDELHELRSAASKIAERVQLLSAEAG
ncbi:MAG: malate dehydrogenase [Microbacterium sp.]